MKTFFDQVRITSVGALQEQSHELAPEQGWTFRGHKDRTRGLTTTLHAACTRHDVPNDEIPDTERQLVREFARKAHLYVRDSAELPDPTDTLEWLSLMRHYGAPTRLLDWSYSIYVAAHFALDATAPGEPAYIWAVNARWLNEVADRAWEGRLRKGAALDYDKTGEHFREFFMPDKEPRAFVSTENPYRMNTRLAIQHGVFLCPGNVSLSFEENLLGMVREEEPRQARELALDNGPRFRAELGSLLARQNINTEVLFPGLEGLARALRDRIPQLRNMGLPKNRARIDWLGRAPRDGHSRERKP